MKYIAQAIEAMLRTGARKASCYVNENHVVTATRPFKPDKRAKSFSIVVTIGRPNFRGRMFVKACRKAGVSFPVRKVQLKFFPK